MRLSQIFALSQDSGNFTPKVRHWYISIAFLTNIMKVTKFRSFSYELLQLNSHHITRQPFHVTRVSLRHVISTLSVNGFFNFVFLRLRYGDLFTGSLTAIGKHDRQTQGDSSTARLHKCLHIIRTDGNVPGLQPEQ